MFSVLPEELQDDIYLAWQTNSFKLSSMLFVAVSFQDPEFIRKSLAWYYWAADVNYEVCWFTDIQNHIKTHRSTLGAINNAFVLKSTNPDTSEYVMPRRLLTLPPGRLRTDKAICFKSDNQQYQWLKAQIDKTVDPPGSGKYFAFDMLQIDFGKWAGTIGLAMKAMLRHDYVCPEGIKCQTETAQVGKAFLPLSYSRFLDQIRRIVREDTEICFALANQLPDRLDAYWFIPGVMSDYDDI
ncbi:hypothetical protein CDD81_5227 [Ophiocordyceps australis]|uniref:Uncharacterized protein n=1 Tax=Ophiocordyceps australis TaxID=1399860 RepID=A0A2C5YBJ9_9HYPO|nr:hypothetical protein CDD81_5227 [Ophiocordyceps australis]